MMIGTLCGLSAVLVRGQGEEAKDTPAEFEELQKAAKDALVVVVGTAKSVMGNTTADKRRLWEVTFNTTKLLKGKLASKEFKVHVESPVRSFDTSRSSLPGHSFVLPLVKLSAKAEPLRFRLVGERAFEAGSTEGKILSQIAEGTFRKPAPVNLKLLIESAEPAYSVDKPVVLKVKLTNIGAAAVTYLQAPIVERGDILYLAKHAEIRIRDNLGREVPDKGAVVRGVSLPDKPSPAYIISRASFSATVDLSKYFELGRKGKYAVTVALPTPDGRGLIESTEATFHVGASMSAVASTAARTGSPPAVPVKLAEPVVYRPGRILGGLSSLLRPVKRVVRIGQPVMIEFRLTNVLKDMLSVETRLERVLTVYVREKHGSAPVRRIRQIIAWPTAPEGARRPLSWLEKSAFWGRVININSLYGMDTAAIEPPSPDDISGSGPFSYEKFGKTLFGFESPGTYEVYATYSCRRSAGTSTPNLWSGTLTTNTIVITIENGRRAATRP
jgi:hypothetical protein